VIKCEGKKNHSADLNINGNVQLEWSVLSLTLGCMTTATRARKRERDNEI